MNIPNSSFLDSRSSTLDSRLSILASRNSNVSTFATRESSFENRVETVNLPLSGTVGTQKEEITINVANDQKVRIMAATLEIGLESVDGKVDTTIVVKTSDKICGGMKPTDWVRMKQHWNHLKDIPFPHLAAKEVIHVR